MIAYAIMVISVCFFLLPMLWIVYCSFRTQESIFTAKIFPPLEGFTLDNYRRILSVTDFPRYFLNSLRISSLVTLISLVVSVLGAYGLSRYDIKGKDAIIVGIFSTQMFPQVLMLIPLFLVVFSLNLMDTTTGVALTQLILVLPFCMWMLKGYFDTVPKDLDQSAEVDGANLFQRLVHIILPVASPGIAVVAFYSFVVSWSDYLIVSVVSQSQRTATVTLTISRLTASLLVRWGQVCAVATLTIVPTLILFAFVQRRLVEGLTAGALKE
ncbi:MAG: carbohydrate ABC transporter permease [Bacillota bacterium]|nr:carbohydrate ABC transporter permease [Bacillota bacterium]HOB91983.1 carbohydrate ABC transporter permease [Bacillota bacterium]HPZ55256.1 carbohydrate ABC transporter permease [Bacillota bacterium]HQD18204.1 carbohydrate ABC transporter permease [Bacillota bacterium]